MTPDSTTFIRTIPMSINGLKKLKAEGFTLLELLVTIAIAGVLLGIGLPSFGNMMAESRISAQYNSFVGSLYQARSEAIKGGADITVCPRSAIEATSCGGADDWENGWIVFRDQTNSPSETVALIETQDSIISVKPAMKGLNTVMAFGSSTNQVSNVADVAYVRYLQNGSSSLTTGSIVICDAVRGSPSSRALNVSLTGDIRRGSEAANSTIPRDAFNRPVSCPEPAT